MSITRFFFLFSFLLLFTTVAYAKPNDGNSRSTIQCRVIHISDGDSFTCLSGNNKRIKVRLLGIDAPENGQPYSAKSKQFLAALILQQKVDLQIEGIDKFARRLARVYDAQQRDINLLMIENGWAWAYRFYKKDPRYPQAQQRAKWKKLGLWQDNNPQEPYLWRKAQR
ncbi:thermonuclease family protein [Testudinibacter sp. TR-2022]|uniref:thermonuclease family protein n=1 Tax=Testudinibacter sp. TR-2022 TaxID=2585029 RepID=UPI00111A18A0|nr:thermonuclease family protein [Testudinibacter sp. TR-2022]TNH06570.1 chromosome partitioning protein ParB [Pasteurellaceae bacterium Phil11]TNH23862.1 chromosome partitioning protein ParB [Testudinibacter sp. TR-2022]TNH24723.1 chromosome partitioning protein ParB [Testudinibacter sp. TR-2022]